MTPDQKLAQLLQQAQNIQAGTTGNGGAAGSTISVRTESGRRVSARCATTVPPGECVAMLGNAGWIALPANATRQVGSRQVGFRQSRVGAGGPASGLVYLALDATWVNATWFNNAAFNNAAFFSALWGGRTNLTVYCIPQGDSRVVGHPNNQWTAARDHISMTVTEMDFSNPIPGPVWLPLLDFNSTWTSTELANITVAAKQHGGMIMGEVSVWYTYAQTMVNQFQPAWSAGLKAGRNNRDTPWSTAQGEVFVGNANFFDSDATIPDSHVLARNNGGSDDQAPAVVQLWPSP